MWLKPILIAGGVVWTAVNDLVVEVLRASNSNLVAIEGGMDTSSKENAEKSVNEEPDVDNDIIE